MARPLGLSTRARVPGSVVAAASGPAPRKTRNLVRDLVSAVFRDIRPALLEIPLESLNCPGRIIQSHVHECDVVINSKGRGEAVRLLELCKCGAMLALLEECERVLVSLTGLRQRRFRCWGRALVIGGLRSARPEGQPV